MKELSERARVILERYRAAQRGSDSGHAPLLDIVLDRARRGDLPKFDVNAAPPTPPAPHLLSRFWSSAFGKLSVVVALLGAAAAGSYWHVRSGARVSQARIATVATSAVTSLSALALETMAEQRVVEPIASSAVPSTPQAAPSSAPVEKTAKANRPSSSASEATIDEEVRLLNAAQAALRAGDSAQALHLLSEYAARFPNGAMASTRSILHMMALTQAGRTEQACAEAKRFLASDPKSPFADRVKAICPQLGQP